jgi:hypothetical protein
VSDAAAFAVLVAAARAALPAVADTNAA